MTNRVIQSILSLVAAVLHLGNVTFIPKQVGGVEGCAVKDLKALNDFCSLAKLDSSVLVQTLTYRELQTMAPGGKVNRVWYYYRDSIVFYFLQSRQIDVYQVPQTTSQASTRRDAIAKAIYSNLFDLIVSRINIALENNTADTVAGREDADGVSISVLDIYGFEVFKSNGFEQLCINYVNEKLQVLSV